MEQIGTLYVSIPVSNTFGSKLVTVTRVTDVTERQARKMFEEWQMDNPTYKGSAMWKTTRVAFF